MSAIVESLSVLRDVLLIRPPVHADARGTFVETYQRNRYVSLGIRQRFVQDNLSKSKRHVLRGLHYQHPNGQDKLVRVAAGTVWDVVVDVRLGSPSFGIWAGVRLSAEDQHQLFIPSGFAHGFVVLTKEAVFEYKCTAVYEPKSEQCLRWDDPQVGIEWPVSRPIVSERDGAGATLADLRRRGALPAYES
jgi:dTDP-4-dehydrorhamnose 3,5-epimerase